VRRKLGVPPRQIQNRIDPTNEMIGRHNLIKMKLIEQLTLIAIQTSHHRKPPPTWCGDGIIVRRQQRPTFVTKSTQSRPGLSIAACRRWPRPCALVTPHPLHRSAGAAAAGRGGRERDGARGMRSVSAFRVDHAGAHPFGEATRRSFVVA